MNVARILMLIAIVKHDSPSLKTTESTREINKLLIKTPKVTVHML